MTPVRLEPAAPRSRVKHSTTEPLCSLAIIRINTMKLVVDYNYFRLIFRTGVILSSAQKNASMLSENSYLK